MAGTIVTERVAGIPSGFPSEIDSSIKVRWVAPLLMNMSERSADFLKYVGGLEQFKFNNTTVEWVEDDVWNRRLSHSGLADGSTTSLTVTGAAHRYPIGTIFHNAQDNEYVRVSGHTDANTLVIQRDITATVTEGAWTSTDEVYVSGFAMDENDDYVFRPTSIFTMPYNRPQVHQTGVQASFRRQETSIYGLNGSDLDKQASDLVAEQFVAINQAIIHSYRYDGTSAVPSMMGGMKFFITSANGAEVSNLSGAALTRNDIDDTLQEFFYSVGDDKMSKTIITSAWGKRKISSFFANAERMESQASGAAGVVVTKLNTDFGEIDVMMERSVAKDELFFVNRNNIQVGHHGNLGRPQLRMLPPSIVGPRSQKVFYGDISAIVAGVQGMGRIHNFSTSS